MSGPATGPVTGAGDRTTEPAPDRFSERLWVPVSWWLVAAVIVGSLWWAYAAFVGPLWASLLAGVVAALVVGGFLAYGNARIELVGDTLRAGRARLPLAALGQASALSEEQAARMRGRDADATAYYLLRPYLRRAVLVEVTDERDPTPYLYLASRRPDRLAAAIGAARARRTGEKP